LIKELDSSVEFAIEEEYLAEDECLTAWNEMRDLDLFLHKYLFVEKDQVVVPSLNLKSAKQIFCQNEKKAWF